MFSNPPDSDPIETQEWLDSVEAVVESDGRDRMGFLLDQAIDHAQEYGVKVSAGLSTPYVNTIPVDEEAPLPGNPELERLATALVRWNAIAIVLQANAESTELGGHIASYQSAETLYEIGFNHFWRARSADHGGDLVYIQGHSSPGIYARAFLEGRLSEEQLHNFRQEVGGAGLSSYPHPWLMPDFWQFPTVSMGLGPLMAIYQARFLKYMAARGMLDPGDRKVWAFMGDGEMDEPESMGAISLAGREKLDNLVFVINCNLQRLDGPVRGNGKIIQELETNFRGAGWNVIKVIWGSGWDTLLEADTEGWLHFRMDEAVDGDYQTFKAKDGAYVREHFFGKYPETRAMVADWTDEEIWELRRGGHDPQKVYAAYAAAVQTKGQPTVILAKTIKGYGMGEAGEGRNITHQQKSMNDEARLAIRDRLGLELTDQQATGAFLLRPPEDHPELKYLLERRAALGGSLPARDGTGERLPVPPPFANVLEGSGERENSTTMAFVRILNALVRDEAIGQRIVPIVPDESRTFGMEGMFRQLGIFSQVGQLYSPEDSEDFMFYREDEHGQILQEGINEPGAFSSWIAAATSYANHGVTMIPFYIFYSMFGFQRVGDLAWAAGDSRARGFLIGATSGRTTLNGEGLQHEDGHSHVLAATIPNCRAYDPTYGYELAVIIRDGLRRMCEEQEDVFYYLTVMNEPYVQPALPEGAEEGILRGLYLLREGVSATALPRVQLLGSGAILREVLAGAELLETDFHVAADVWSVTSFTELRRDGLEAERWSRLHPTEPARDAYVHTAFEGRSGPFVAATDYMRTFADQIRPFVPGSYTVLGTDGFGRSDYRTALRRFFEVDRYHVAVAALKALADEGAVEAAVVQSAIERYGIDPDAAPPWTR
jgi:pyruvate dehydrogenase E1 component